MLSLYFVLYPNDGDNYKEWYETTFVWMSVFCFDFFYLNKGCEVASDVIMWVCCLAEE